MLNARTYFVLAIATAAISALPVTAYAAAPPAPRNIPGLVAPDTHPNACVDCHIVYKDKGLDERFSVLLKAWTAGKIEPGLLAQAKASAPAGLTLKGKHPDATDSLEDIPGACLDCHSSGSKKAPPFSKLIHLVHLTGGAKNHYMTVYQGECTLCHKLNAKTGEWSIPSGPEK